MRREQTGTYSSVGVDKSRPVVYNDQAIIVRGDIMAQLAQILEIMMLVCFGFSWPISVVKSLKTRSTKNKSPIFLCLIIFGYICGMASKFVSGHIVWYVLFFYVLNSCMVTIDLVLYFINKKREKSADGENNN